MACTGTVTRLARLTSVGVNEAASSSEIIGLLTEMQKLNKGLLTEMQKINKGNRHLWIGLRG